MPPPAPQPSFRQPPVQEVVISVQFADLPLSVIHFGQWFDENQDRFPAYTSAPRRPRIVEEFPRRRSTNTPLLRVAAGPDAERIAFRSKDGHTVVQFQADRFSYHWHRDEAAHPGFQAVRDGFDVQWVRFIDFVVRRMRGTVIRPDLAEVQYFNQIEVPAGTAAGIDFLRVFGGVPPETSDRLLPEANEIQFNRVFAFPSESCRLYAEAAALHDPPAILFNQTARANILSDSDLYDRIEDCHGLINRGILDLTSEDVRHRRWGQET